MQKETIVQKVYEMLKYTIPVLNRYPKNQKFVLADRIQNQLTDLLELYIEAFYASSNRKKTLLVRANVTLEKLRHLFRLSYELNLIHEKRYEDFSMKLNEIGKMTGGWLRSLP